MKKFVVLHLVQGHSGLETKIELYTRTLERPGLKEI